MHELQVEDEWDKIPASNIKPGVTFTISLFLVQVVKLLSHFKCYLFKGIIDVPKKQNRHVFHYELSKANDVTENVKTINVVYTDQIISISQY